ncbi:MAG TPA: DEAD/DEAH box helicase, partial [Candidatus Hodarchaeales archaeon]|nr:DEAD/DEAH box helicase [Candidatus Hodarchaeales archaeon]
VPNLDLVEQWKQRITSFLQIPVTQIGIFSGLRKAFEDHDIVISTYQLLSQYIKDYYTGQVDEQGNPIKSYDTKILEAKIPEELGDDEEEGDTDSEEQESGKHSVAKLQPQREFRLVAKTLDVFRSKFGLLIADECHHISAETFKEIALHLEIPHRLALSATMEWTFNTGLILSTMGPKIYEVRYGQLSKAKYIAPIVYRQILVRLTPAEQKTLAEKKSPGRGFKSKICRHAANKLIAIKEVARSSFTSQILIFTSRVNHAREISEFLTSNNIDSTLLVGETVTNNQERENTLERFRKEEIHVLILVKMLNEGFDAPCDTVLIASGSKNPREHIQRIGRATRPGRVAKIFELVVDPQDLDVEADVAKMRDAREVIEPWVQDSLVDKTLLNEIEQTFKPQTFFRVKT